MSLFHYAAYAGHWNLIESLVTEYCQHEYPSDETLLIACRQGQHLLVRSLMREIKYDISNGRAIKVAVTAGQADVLKHLLDDDMMKGKRAPSYDIKPNASSLLNLAATNGHEDVVDTIFNYCNLAEVQCVNEVDGRTPLFSAVMNSHENVVRKLLANGATIKANGTTAIHIAAEHGDQNILRILFKATANNPDTNRGTEMKDSGLTLLRSYDTKGDTPLHKAARNGHSAAVQTILEHRPTIVDVTTFVESDSGDSIHSGLMAVHLAASGGHLSVLQILANSKADFRMRAGPSRASALHFAAADGHQAVVEWLLKNGADPHAVTTERATALELACGGGYEAIVRALLKKDSETPGLPNLHHPKRSMMVNLIESAAEERREALLGNLLGCVGALVGAYGEDYLKKLIRTAKREISYEAIGALESLQENRRWEQFTDL